MSPNPSPRRALAVFLLLVALVFAGLPVYAQPVHRPPAGIGKVAGLGEDAFAWVRDLFASWLRGLSKEGPTIDPDGRPNSQPDEGPTIDPNG